MRNTTHRLLSVLLGCALVACHGETTPDGPDDDATHDGLPRVITLVTGHRVTVGAAAPSPSMRRPADPPPSAPIEPGGT